MQTVIVILFYNDKIFKKSFNLLGGSDFVGSESGAKLFGESFGSGSRPGFSSRLQFLKYMLKNLLSKEASSPPEKTFTSLNDDFFSLHLFFEDLSEWASKPKKHCLFFAFVVYNLAVFFGQVGLLEFWSGIGETTSPLFRLRFTFSTISQKTHS